MGTGIKKLSEPDSLSALFARFGPGARVFHTGDFCRASTFAEDDGAGHLHMVKNGTLVVTENGEEIARVEGPGLVFYPRGTAHRLAPVGPAATVLCAMVDLGGGGEGPLARTFPERLVLSGEDAIPLDPLFDLLFTEAFDRRFGRQAALDGLVLFFMVRLIRHLIETARIETGLLAALADARLARVVGALHERPERAWTLEAMADVAGMSRARFADRFKRNVGVTAAEYLTDLRLGMARALLGKGRTVKAASAAVGYADPAAFSRAFRKRTGANPRAWIAGTGHAESVSGQDRGRSSRST